MALAADFGLAVLHFTAILIIAGALSAQAVLLRLTSSREIVEALRRADLLYLAGAGLVILAGHARVFWGAKGADFYYGQPAFWVKMGLFVAVGALSVPATLAFRRWRRNMRAAPGFAPDAAELRNIRRLVMIEAHLLAALVIAAGAMARGIGAS